MNGISEINCRCPARQSDQPALGCKTKNLIVKKFQFGMFEKFFRITFGQLFDSSPQPCISPTFMAHALGGVIFVQSMGGNAEISNFIHFLGTDLQFDPLTARPDNRRMDRAVIILFGRRDIILETPGYAWPGTMDDTQHRITVLNRFNDHPETQNIR